MNKYKNIICNKCNNNGKFCSKCGGLGKVDWIENLRDTNYQEIKKETIFPKTRKLRVRWTIDH